jgi:hypothetical protein
VNRLEGKLSCLRRVPVNEYTDFAGYGDPANGPNAMTSYGTSLDWAFTDLPSDYFVLAIRADR